MKFNSEKCSILHLGKNNPQYLYTIVEGDTTVPLKVSESEKDLGVTMDPELCFELHIDNAIKKARTVSGMIIRGISYKSQDVMVPLFKALV